LELWNLLFYSEIEAAGSSETAGKSVRLNYTISQKGYIYMVTVVLTQASRSLSLVRNDQSNHSKIDEIGRKYSTLGREYE
jgi:hypothetical protein